MVELGLCLQFVGWALVCCVPIVTIAVIGMQRTPEFFPEHTVAVRNADAYDDLARVLPLPDFE